MRKQLVLIDEDGRDWRLDEHTREVGRRGLERARHALAHPSRQRTRPNTEHGDDPHRRRAA